MNHYTMTPNKDATTWLIKIEDVAAPIEYDKYDEAIKAGEQMACKHQPSTLTVLDKFHEEVETRVFDENH